MKGQEAGVMTPTSNLKYFVSYLIVFAVAAVLVVKHSESRTSNPPVQLTLHSDSSYVAKVMGEQFNPNETAFEFLFCYVEEPEKEEVKDVIPEISGPEDLYFPIILEAAKRYQVDPLLVKAMIEVESGFNPNAVSHVGAQGLMQLMPRTAKYLGVEDSFNPEHNINGGVKYFKRLLDRFNGDIKLALAAYNAGSRKVHKYRGVPPYSETRNYIEKVFKLHTDYKKSKSESDKKVLLTQS